MKCRLRTAFTPTKFRVNYSVDQGVWVKHTNLDKNEVVDILTQLDDLRDEGHRVDYMVGRNVPKPYTVVV